MKRYLFATSLAVTLVLIGCSKKDGPAPAPLVGTGSYRYDGALATCQVSASTSSGTIVGGTVGGVGTQTEYLLVTLKPTPALATGEFVRVEFGKPAGQPNAAYGLSSVTYFPNNTSTVGELYNSINAATLSENSDGSFTGTFSGTDFSNPAHTITAGAFTGVRP